MNMKLFFKLRLKEYSVSYENGFFEYSVSSQFLIRTQFVSFLTEKVNFIHRKIARQFLALGTWVLRFLTLKKFKNWFLINRFLIKKVFIMYLMEIRSFLYSAFTQCSDLHGKVNYISGQLYIHFFSKINSVMALHISVTPFRDLTFWA